MPFTPFRTSLLGVATEVGMLFHGEIVSMMILRPAKALSTSRCTRSVSDFKNSCSALSSKVSPSSSLIELDVRRATEDRISRLYARVEKGALDCPAPSDHRFRFRQSIPEISVFIGTYSFQHAYYLLLPACLLSQLMCLIGLTIC